MGGSASSTIDIHFDDIPPFAAGKQITGTITLNNKLNKNVKCKRLYVELFGEVIYTVRDFYLRSYASATTHESFFQQSINLVEREEEFTLANDHYSWSINFSLPTFLPPSLDQLSEDGPYIRYKLRIISEPSKIAWNCQEFPIRVIASPSSCPNRSDLPVQARNKNNSGVIVRATLTDPKTYFVPGEDVLLNIELHNRNHKRIKALSIELIQHRTLAMGKHCQQTISFADIPHLREFSGENYRETLQLKIPYDNRIIPSFYYMGPEFLEKPVSVEYTFKIKVKTDGFFNDFILNLPIQVHSVRMYMPPPDADEPPPPPYEIAIATL